MKKTTIFILSLFSLIFASFAISQFVFPTVQNKSFEWESVPPEDVNLNNKYLLKLIKEIKDSTFYSIDGILVIRNGKIALEEYFNGFTKDSFHNTTSVGKSVTSALTGIAIERGLIPDKKAKMVDFFNEQYRIENLSNQKHQIEVEHLLTMSSGLACDDWDENSPGNTMHFPDVPDDFAFTLNLPMINMPGKRFAYCSGGANLLGEIIRKKSGQSLKDFADEHLFNKIGIQENEWFLVPKPPYYEFSGGGNFLKPRDMARFGLLYLNKGMWQGEQILLRKWVEESTTKQIQTPEDGYLWWIKEFKYEDKVVSAFEASGNGGNKITAIPELDIVIILTGSGYGSEYIEGEQAHTIMEKYIIAAAK